MEAKIVDGNLVLTMPLGATRLSSSGKSRIVATTGGFVDTEAEVDGHIVKVSVNATIPLAKAA